MSEQCINRIMTRLVYGKKDAVLSIRINSDVKKVLEAYSEKSGLTISDIVRIIFERSIVFREIVREYCEEVIEK